MAHHSPIPLPDGFERFPREALEQSIPERFARVAARAPDRLAVVAPDRRLTYAELDGASDRVAAAIVGRAGDDNEPVVVLAGQSASLVAGIMGALKARRCYVPLDAAFPEPRLRRTVERSGADVVLATAATRGLAQRLSGRDTQIVDIDDPGAIAGRRWRRPGPDDLAYVYYTSGSTGEPKGVCDTHRNVLHNVMRYTNTLGFTPADRLTLLQRPAFSGAVSSLFGAILNGATSCIFDLAAEGPAALRRWLAAERITVYHSVPSIFRAIAHDGAAYEQLRIVRLEGDRAARVDLELFDRHFRGDTVLVNGLGATECGLVRQFVFRPGDPLPDTVPVGYPVEDMEVTVAGTDHGALPVGEAGEIVVTSRYLAQGYWHDRESTDLRFVSEPGRGRSYRTGDRGRLDADGCLHLLGRTDLRQRFRGQDVEAEAIERALVAAALAREVAVRAHVAPDGNERLVAYVVPPDGTAPGGRQLREALAGHLPAASLPTDFVLLDALPVGESGKVDVDALALPSRSRTGLGVPYVGPRNVTEAALASIWARVLGVDRVGVLDGFRDLGGDSLSAAEVLAEAATRLDVDLPQSVLIHASTIDELARAIERAVQGAAPPAVQRLQGGTATPIVFATGDLVGGGLYCRRLAPQLGPERPFYAVSPYDPRVEPVPGTIEEMARGRLGELRELLPAGECVVAGFCGPGGVLAYELAAQLEREGSSVSALILIDTFPIAPRLPGEMRRPPLGTVIRGVSRMLRAVPALRRRVLPVLGRWRRRPLHAPDMLTSHERAAALYDPGPIDAPIRILWPADEPRHPSLARFRKGWSAVSPRTAVTPIPGDHLAAVTVESEGLAAAMLEAIAAVEAGTADRRPR